MLIQTCEDTKSSFLSNYLFFQKIDALPRGFASWKCEFFETVGDVLAEDGKPCTELVELWKRDPVDCIRELIGNPLYCHAIQYAPEKHYADAEGKTRIFGNLFMGDWSWNVQGKLPPGATVASVILASDKTMLSRMSGDKSAWPVYLTLGNIDKNERRKPSSHATVLLGYLPISKLECFSEKRRSLEGYRLFHQCMKALLAPLVAAGKEGVMMTCADGRVRRVYPILTAYIADHPEQCLVSGCQENFCPKCPVAPNEQGEPVLSCLKDPERARAAFESHARGDKSADFVNWGLCAIEPFWDDLPHCNIFSALTPDLLHQLHKGVFKDHLVSWATKAIEDRANEIDRRFQAMLKHSDLRHFSKGISLVSQWTGTEFRHMQKVFLGVVAGASEERVTRAVRAVLDFIYYAHFECHTDISLNALHQSWLDYHRYKAVFVELGIRSHFNFPKGHSTEHYEPSIRSVGTADGYNTEHPERLHIDYAKLAYGASNKQSSYTKQMARWLDRQEAVHRFTSYQVWCDHESTESTAPSRRSSRRCTDKSNWEDDEPGEDESPFYRGYSIAKTPSFPSITLLQAYSDFGAHSLARCLKDYLLKCSHGRPDLQAIAATPLHEMSRISAYKQFKVRLPVIRQVSPLAPVDIIHASPARQGGPNPFLTKPQYMSTVLAHDPGMATQLSHHPLHGLRVARIRLIFQLPQQLNPVAFSITDPLTYVEWFTPFQVVDGPTGMYVVLPSMRQHQRNASVIPITDIQRTCHLIPCWGKRIDRQVVEGDVLDNTAMKFFVNPYLRHHNFVLFRYMIDHFSH
ncbi:hypothetical protein C8Q79DRAFT_914885 [Trametes meyenii]|nr:hypothetical protein C8Q79DRAFT_914885 [Trametes meyenii]